MRTDIADDLPTVTFLDDNVLRYRNCVSPQPTTAQSTRFSPVTIVNNFLNVSCKHHTKTFPENFEN